MSLELIKDSFNFLMIAGILLGIIFIISALFSKRGRDSSVLYLVLVVLFLTLNNLQIILIDTGLVKVNFFVSKLLIPWYLLIFPSFYSFLIYYLKIDKKVHSYISIVLALFVIEIFIRIAFIPYFLNEGDNYIVAKYAQIEEIINALFTVFLFVKAFLLLFNYSNLYKEVLSYDNIKWLKIFMSLGSVIVLLWITAIICNIGKVINPVIYIYYPMRLSCSILLYWIGYQGFFHYNIMTQRIQLREVIAEENRSNSKLLNENPSIDVSNKENSFLIIKNHIEKHNRFLDPTFSLEVLASEIKMSTTKVSNSINQNSGYNFSDYVNQLRVNKAKKYLIKPEYSHYNIETIGYECGFNSKSTFYLAFKKFTNTTPTAFRKSST